MLLFLKKATRGVLLLAERHLERRRLASLYTPDPTNLDLHSHFHAAVDWLKRGQDAGLDRGVAYGTYFGKSFDVSYPETTGYICQTFVELEGSTGESELLDRAVEMGDWEIDIQLPDGSVMGGKFNLDPTPAIFNTGMVLLGWSALIRRTGEARFKEASRRAAEWMVAMQEPDGHWIRGHSQFASSGPTLYSVMAAWGLAEAGAVLGERRYVEAAERNAEYCISHQHSNGWFAQADFSQPTKPLLHTQAYCMQGLLGVGRVANREDLIAGATLFADAQIRIMRPDGFLPGRQDAEFRPAARWCCLTGSAQTSVVWAELYLRSRDRKYLQALRTVNRYLMAHHDIRNPDEGLRGGVTGSWPVWGAYGRLMVLSWATKFLVDALRLEMEISAEEDQEA
jgi:hypothetical protein